MFFTNLAQYKEQLAVIEGEVSLTYGQLDKQCQEFARAIKVSHKSLFFLFAHNRISTLIAYLSLLQQDQAIMLLDPDIDGDALDNLIENYRPAAMINQTLASGLIADVCYQPQPKTDQIDSKLALLLSTSGSTGAKKQVALSYANLHLNAESICAFLPIQKTDRALCNLPFFYVYGLSVINSHLASGACCVLSDVSPVSRGFWQLIEQQGITSLAGVPYTYEMLLRLRVTSKTLPSMRYFTLAGGKLAPEKVVQLAEYGQQHGKGFYVMYGQTEATARMSYLPAVKTSTKPGSIGQAIPGGRFELRDENDQPFNTPDTIGELCYFGPNIMLGYVRKAVDLANFAPQGMLRTGDLAYFDADGDYYIAGRKSRFIKLFGQRIGLDEVEQLLEQDGVVSYCCGNDQKLVIAMEQQADKELDLQSLGKQVASKLRLHASVIQVLAVADLPKTPSGKKDYHSIMQLAGDAL